MQILVISDSHDNVANLEAVINWANSRNIDIIIHAGDISAPSVVKNTLVANFSGQIHLIAGNIADKILLKEVCKDLAQVKYYGDEGELLIGTTNIFLTHYPEAAEKAASSGKYDLVIHGHTHKAVIKQFGNTLLVNPGTVGGLYNKATFATIDLPAKIAQIHDL